MSSDRSGSRRRLASLRQRGKLLSQGGRTLEEVKAALSVSRVIEAYVPLEKVGTTLVCCCPFNPERTASFYVYVHEGKWKCYSCGLGGDVYDFVQRMEHWDLKEALDQLEAKYLFPLSGAWSSQPSSSASGSPGVVTPSYPSGSQASGGEPGVSESSSDRRLATSQTGSSLDLEQARHAVSVPPAFPSRLSSPEMIQQTMDRAHVAYVAGLRIAPKVVKSYAIERGITGQLAKRLELGYSSGFTLYNTLKSHPDLRVAARGCHLMNDQNHDRLSSRLIVPEIRDGHVIFMIGRAIPPPEMAATRVMGSEEPEDPKPNAKPNGQLVFFPGVTPSFDGSAPSLVPPAETASSPATHARRQMRNKYLMVGPRLVLGLGLARQWFGVRSVLGVVLIEGAFDWVVSQQWDLPLPVLSLLGTDISSAQIQEIVEFVMEASNRAEYQVPVLLALDSNPEGEKATPIVEERLAAEGLRTCRTPPLVGGADLGDLAKPTADPEGWQAFVRSLLPFLNIPPSEGAMFPVSGPQQRAEGHQERGSIEV